MTGLKDTVVGAAGAAVIACNSLVNPSPDMPNTDHTSPQGITRDAFASAASLFEQYAEGQKIGQRMGEDTDVPGDDPAGVHGDPPEGFSLDFRAEQDDTDEAPEQDASSDDDQESELDADTDAEADTADGDDSADLGAGDADAGTGDQDGDSGDGGDGGDGDG